MCMVASSHFTTHILILFIISCVKTNWAYRICTLLLLLFIYFIIVTCIYFTYTVNTTNIKNTQPSIGLISHFETISKLKCCEDGKFTEHYIEQNKQEDTCKQAK